MRSHQIRYAAGTALAFRAESIATAVPLHTTLFAVALEAFAAGTNRAIWSTALLAAVATYCNVAAFAADIIIANTNATITFLFLQGIF